MLCPYCGHSEDRVVDSRLAEEGRAIRRRRECEACGERYTTFERLEQVPLLVEKRSGEREAFDREKLIGGLRKACKNRPVPMDDIEKLADDVAGWVRAEGRIVVESSALGREVLERLRDLDEVAYLRFASVYKDFQELTDFEREVGLLQKKIPPKQPSPSRGPGS
ncbi:MAG: transcriptional regulator NrdR [Actinomycetota bacterium]